MMVMQSCMVASSSAMAKVPLAKASNCRGSGKKGTQGNGGLATGRAARSGRSSSAGAAQLVQMATKAATVDLAACKHPGKCSACCATQTLPCKQPGRHWARCAASPPAPRTRPWGRSRSLSWRPSGCSSAGRSSWGRCPGPAQGGCLRRREGVQHRPATSEQDRV